VDRLTSPYLVLPSPRLCQQEWHQQQYLILHHSCSISSHTEEGVRRFWSPSTSLPFSASPTAILANLTTPGGITALSSLASSPATTVAAEGRRLKISDDLCMFHPAFLPQLICQVLSQIPFITGGSNTPKIWQGGVVFRSVSGCSVGLYMHGAFIEEKMKRRMEQRRHGEPERLQTLDLLVKGENEEEIAMIMQILLAAVSSVANEYWRSLKWSESVLLPASVKNYFSLPHKKRIASLSLCNPTTSSSFETWTEIRQVIVDKGKWPKANTSTTPTSTVGNDLSSSFTSLHLACHEGDISLLKSECSKVLSSLSFFQELASPLSSKLGLWHQSGPAVLVANGRSLIHVSWCIALRAAIQQPRGRRLWPASPQTSLAIQAITPKTPPCIAPKMAIRAPGVRIRVSLFIAWEEATPPPPGRGRLQQAITPPTRRCCVSNMGETPPGLPTPASLLIALQAAYYWGIFW